MSRFRKGFGETKFQEVGTTVTRTIGTLQGLSTAQPFDGYRPRHRSWASARGLPQDAINSLDRSCTDRDHVISRAAVQQLEARGKRIVAALFKELVRDPEKMIPKDAWKALDPEDTKYRRVCDYIAGMTDPYAEKIYRRLFIPGFGSSGDEL